MTEQAPSLLGAAVDWHLDKVEALSAAGVQSRVRGPSIDRSKNSVTMEFVSSRMLIGVTIWDSGEGEAIRDSPDQADPVVEVLRLVDVAAVRDLLNRIEVELAGKR